MFPGYICVSGFATPVVNFGTARVPMGWPMQESRTHCAIVFQCMHPRDDAFNLFLPSLALELPLTSSHICVCLFVC